MDLTQPYKKMPVNYAKLSYELGNAYQSVPAIYSASEKYPEENANRQRLKKLI
jgi:hypothetical protein